MHIQTCKEEQPEYCCRSNIAARQVNVKGLASKELRELHRQDDCLLKRVLRALQPRDIVPLQAAHGTNDLKVQPVTLPARRRMSLQPTLMSGRSIMIDWPSALLSLSFSLSSWKLRSTGHQQIEECLRLYPLLAKAASLPQAMSLHRRHRRRRPDALAGPPLPHWLAAVQRARVYRQGSASAPPPYPSTP